MHRIIRIENLSNRGLYQHDLLVGARLPFNKWHGPAPASAADILGWKYMDHVCLGAESDRIENDPRPAPSDDGLLASGNGWHYGFSDVAQLRAWFDNKVNVADVIDSGLQICLVEATHVQFGGKQVRYHPDSVTKVIRVVNSEFKNMFNTFLTERKLAEQLADEVRKDRLDQLIKTTPKGRSNGAYSAG